MRAVNRSYLRATLYGRISRVAVFFYPSFHQAFECTSVLLGKLCIRRAVAAPTTPSFRVFESRRFHFQADPASGRIRGNPADNYREPAVLADAKFDIQDLKLAPISPRSRGGGVSSPA